MGICPPQTLRVINFFFPHETKSIFLLDMKNGQFVFKIYQNILMKTTGLVYIYFLASNYFFQSNLVRLKQKTRSPLLNVKWSIPNLQHLWGNSLSFLILVRIIWLLLNIFHSPLHYTSPWYRVKSSPSSHKCWVLSMVNIHFPLKLENTLKW